MRHTRLSLYSGMKARWPSRERRDKPTASPWWHLFTHQICAEIENTQLGSPEFPLIVILRDMPQTAKMSRWGEGRHMIHDRAPDFPMSWCHTKRGETHPRLTQLVRLSIISPTIIWRCLFWEKSDKPVLTARRSGRPPHNGHVRQDLNLTTDPWLWDDVNVRAGSPRQWL